MGGFPHRGQFPWNSAGEIIFTCVMEVFVGKNKKSSKLA
jgi:hypothetical protein